MRLTIRGLPTRALTTAAPTPGAPDDRPRGGRRAAPAAAAVLAALALTATACGPDNEKSTDAGGPPAATTAAAPGGGRPALPTSLQDVAGWKLDDWARFIGDNAFVNEVAQGFWSIAKMEDAKGRPTPEYSHKSAGSSVQRDEPPAAIPAKPQPHPYSPATAVVGKIFMTAPEGDSMCSGTVVSDPANPGRSNLVYTAAHCLHDGKGGTWLKNIVFVPGYNRDGQASRGKRYTEQQVSPYGRWTAVKALVSPNWVKESGVGANSQYDYGIIRVRNENGSGLSLEEAVGGSVPIWFNAPREQITSAFSYGYPAERPFDGMELNHCDSTVRPAKLSFDQSRPPMYVIGCTMTGGSSGGGWFITRDGKPNLISVNSIGNRNPSEYMAGPSLQEQAKQAFDYFSKNAK
ncbi:serine protease [Kitasatospora sp. A2-31]|uniref:trypsin-like serine peptidase n=1 Tax=Kitasatospora sp. A2-31 TaxID=2916414 RepID=UPI001EEA0E86|nr:trypsin-like peptidase domain-containing protein [Kitasatospora sp. A2-31]MCG6497554.1 trypsin-like peptidase domain-containing protein [Kitasatospora sp. A2-31]